MAEGATKHGSEFVKMVCASALSSGQVVQAPDSRAAVYNGLKASESGDYVSLYTGGARDVTKSTSVAFLPGQEVWWDSTNNQATYRLAGDFFVGIAVDGATASATKVKTAMNCKPNYTADLAERKGEWTTEATNGLGVVETVGGLITLAFDAVAEAAQAAIYGTRGITAAENPIFEAEIAVYDIGDAANLDINFGLADGSHATDFDTVSDYIAFHLDGNDLSVSVQSDDTANPVAAVDTTVDLVDDTFAFFQLDCRDITDIQCYINGALVLSGSTFLLTASTADLFPIVHVEKTSNDTTADVRIRSMTMRSVIDA